MIYQLVLDELNKRFAVFAADSMSGVVSMPREHWEEIGRPGIVEVTVNGFDG